LTGQLKVNFRPLYSDTIEVLSELGKRYPEMLWTIAMNEINKCHTGDLASLVSVVKPTWAKASLQDETPASNDEGKSFSCPNANKLYQATDQELASDILQVTDTDVVEVSQLRLDTDFVH
jgi:U3 small nucleolar RNA-associated protein 20